MTNGDQTSTEFSLPNAPPESELINRLGEMAVPSLDRQMKVFQFKIQQEIAVKDEEIERTYRDLTEYKARILQMKGNLQRLTSEIESQKRQQHGKQQYDSVSFEATLARRKILHNEQVRAIQAEQADDIDALQRDIASTLARVAEHGQTRASEALKAVEDEMEKTRTQIRTYEESISKLRDGEGPQDASDSLAGELEDERASQLRSIIRARNSERLESLLDSKRKLTECVQVLDEMDRSHATDTARARQRLEQTDARYVGALDRLKAKRADVRAQQTNRLHSAKSGIARMDRALRHLQSGHQQRLKEASWQFGIIQLQFAASAPVVRTDDLNRDQAAKIEQKKARLKAVKQTVAQKEQQLRNARQTNDDLRKEIGQMKHDLRYRVRQPRRPDLGILA
jgi:hypothetical protein